MKLLLVDDDEALLTVISTTLRNGGFDVVTATTGKGGLEKAKSEKPDLVLLDQVLPDIAGNDVLKTLKQDLETKSIPVAMLTNFGQDQQIQDAIQQGAIDYILKYQIEPEDLVTKVKSLLEENSQQPGISTDSDTA